MKEIKRPRLNWKLKDYEESQLEPPEDLIPFPDKTEGELMNEEALGGWILESIKTFKVIKEDNEDLFDEMYVGFAKDLEYLKSINKISEEEAERILNIDNFEF